MSNTQIAVTIENFLFLEPDSSFYKVHSFVLSINNINIHVVGNKMSNDAIKAIKQAKKHSLMIIDHIRYGDFSPEALPRKVNPVIIEIAD